MPAGSSIPRLASAFSEAVKPAPEADRASEEVPVRIVVFNDHPVFKSALSWKIADVSGIELIADTVSLSETLQTAGEAPAGAIDVLVADLRIGDGNSEGVECVKTLATRLDGIPVIVYSDYFSRSFATRMEKAGAAAIVQKSASIDDLAAAILRAVEWNGSGHQKPASAGGNAA